jgi:hypothetical protein
MIKALRITLGVGIALTASVVPTGLLAIWLEDERWGWSGTILFIAGIAVCMTSGIALSEVKERGW